MSEGSVNHEQQENPLPIESKSSTQISQEDISDLGAFADKSIDAYIKASDPQVREEIGTDAFVHTQAVSSLNDAKRLGNELNLAVTKDTDGNVIGYSLVTIDMKNPDPYSKVQTEFLGVDTEHRGQGIATKLMKERIRVLKELGIPGYRTISREAAKKVYDRLGIKYDIEPLPDNTNFAKDAQKLFVKL